MIDQGAPAQTPAAAPPPPAPPAESSDVGGDRGAESDLLKEAMAALKGEEAPPAAENEKPKVEEKPKEELTQKKLSDGFAKLAAKEDRFERRSAEQTAKLQAERAAFEAERAQVAPLREAMEKAKTSPLEALSLLGWTYQHLVDYVMKDGQIPQEKFAERLTNEHKSAYEKLQAEIAELRSGREQERQAYEAQQETSRQEHAVRELFKGDDAPGATKYPNFYAKFSEDPGNAAGLMVDVQNLLTAHYNQTCVRDDKGRIVRPGEKVDPERAVMHIESILAKMQIRPRNPGQPGAVSQTANAGAARQQAPKPLTPRDYSVTSMPSDEEILAMTDEEREALAKRIVSGG